MEAVVTPRGCVAEVDVVHSVPLLDLSAIEAVRRWRFAPSELEGKPVPVAVTIEVIFNLR